MNQDTPKNDGITKDTRDIESWEDDCGLSDLARDQFSQQVQTNDQDRRTKDNHSD